jgi:type VI secretion system protein ImpG
MKDGNGRSMRWRAVLAHDVVLHVPTHSFTTTVLRSKQCGRITAWPPRFGTRSVA